MHKMCDRCGERMDKPDALCNKCSVDSYYTGDELHKMKMKDLRKIGDVIGAKDTSKDELIEEILEKQ